MLPVRFLGQIYTDWEQIDLPNLTVAYPIPAMSWIMTALPSELYLAYQQLKLICSVDHSIFSMDHHQLDARLFDIDYHALAKPLTLSPGILIQPGITSGLPHSYIFRRRRRFNLPMIWVTRW
jgi:hypothetical protein